ncbi:hypothetical protein RDABS01_036910 [Bienertia sinuspersici]
MTLLACCKADFLDEEGHSSSSNTSSEVSSPRRKKKRRRRRNRFIRKESDNNMKRNFTDGKMSIATVVKTFSLKGNKKKQQIEYAERSVGCQKITAQTFTFRQMANATNNFSIENLVGEGGFGRVYKGYIQGIDKAVAVKQLDRNGLQGNREFLSEVFMLGLVDHPNLVNLIGYCADGDQRILVYEYMASGSLEDNLLDVPPTKEPLDWHTRMKIAAGAARGLEDKDHVSTRVMGTYGYCAPEYAMTGQLTTKSDVYSFGVVFLELISGRRAIDTTRPTAEQNLVSWAQPLFKDRKMFTKMADPLLGDDYPVKGLYQALAVAAMCLQEEASTRPLISDVVTALEFLASPEDDIIGSPRDSIIIQSMDEEEQIDEDYHTKLKLNDKEEEEQHPYVVENKLEPLPNHVV